MYFQFLIEDRSGEMLIRRVAEWADRIGGFLELDRNVSPSFRQFVYELRVRAGIIDLEGTT